MSHDIRTPLNGIYRSVANRRRALERRRAADRESGEDEGGGQPSAQLINDVLQMSKLESGEITLAHEPLNLNRLLRANILTIVGAARRCRGGR